MIPFWIMMCGLASAGAPKLPVELRKAEAQLAGNEPARALKTAEGIHAAIAEGTGTLSPAQRDALDRVRSIARAKMADVKGEEPTEHLDRAIQIHEGCLARSAEPARCGDGRDLARALRSRSGLLQVAMRTTGSGASITEAVQRCEQAYRLFPDPEADATCIGMLALSTNDLVLARRAAVFIAATSDGDPPSPKVLRVAGAVSTVLGYRYGLFDEALAVLAPFEDREPSPLADSLRGLKNHLAPLYAAAEARQDLPAVKALLTALDRLERSWLAASEALARLPDAPDGLHETLGTVLFNAAARERKTASRSDLLDWTEGAKTAFAHCAPSNERCAQRVAQASELYDALSR